ncbi:MAG: hypothetical protein ACAI38_06270 [Myxococcota bacterium]|nr:hypothetical protein [Myxococcota bacterium]
MACNFNRACIENAMNATVRRYSGNSDNDFAALRANVSRARGVDVRPYLELADIKHMVLDTRDINMFQDMVADGFIGHFDTKPRDGRITLPEWNEGRRRRPQGVRAQGPQRR